MIELTLLLSMALMGAGGLWYLREQRLAAARWFADELELAADEHGIRFSPRRPSSNRAVGTVDGFAVTIELGWARDEQNRGQTILVVRLQGDHIPSGLSFSAEQGRGEDVLTGDSEFDDVVDVRGEPTIVLALLNPHLRRSVAQFVRLGGRLARTELRWESLAAFSVRELAHSIRMLLVLARALSTPEGGGLCERLARNATSDPDRTVRLLNFSLLEEHFRAAPETEEAARAALQDVNPWMRLAGARRLQDEGLDTLDALAETRGVPDQAAAEAVILVAERRPAEHAGALLLRVLKSRTGDTRRAAVAALGRIRHQPALGALIVLLEHADPRTAAGAAGALGSLGDTRSEAALLKAASQDARELRLAATRALGRLGQIGSVEPLLDLVHDKRLDAEGRQCVRDAVAAIQSRLMGADAGQVSMASTDAGTGWVSPASAPPATGQLSMVDEEEEKG